MGGDKKIYPISLVVNTLDTRFEGLLDRKVCHESGKYFKPS
jgi:hypothetical protein